MLVLLQYFSVVLLRHCLSEAILSTLMIDVIVMDSDACFVSCLLRDFVIPPIENKESSGQLFRAARSRARIINSSKVLRNSTDGLARISHAFKPECRSKGGSAG